MINNGLLDEEDIPEGQSTRISLNLFAVLPFICLVIVTAAALSCIILYIEFGWVLEIGRYNISVIE